MKNRKRVRRCLGLLLAGMLSMSGSADIRADEGKEVNEDAYLAESVNESGGSWEETDTGAPMEETVSDDIVSENTVSDDTMPDAVVSENMVPHQEDENDTEPVVSDNTLSSDVLSQDDVNEVAELEEAENAEEKSDERPVEVVLPSNVSLNMVTFGEGKLEGTIKSEQFCIENTGYEDVKVSVQGICSGENERDLVMTSSSTIDGSVPGKKNAWIYLQWEDEAREILDQPKVVIGDGAGPESRGDILLKAPKRDRDGEVTGENDASKAYFSFAGDMRSDTGETWENGELKLRLSFFVEKTSAGDPNLPEQISTLE